MAVYKVQGPDGKTHSFEGPDGATPDEVIAFAQSQFGESPAPAAAPVPEEGLGRTVFDQGMQGATFGFADEFSDRLGAGIASLSTGQNYGDMLTEARQLTKERQERQWEDRPGATIAANLAGGLLTSGAGYTTKAGAAVGNLLRTGNTTARVAKGAASGAASGGIYGFGSGQGEERLENAGTGAVLGAVGGAAVPAAVAGLRHANTRTIIPGSDEIRKAAGELYKKAERSGGMLKPEFTNSFIAQAQKSLISDDALINAMKSNAPLRDAFEDLATFQNQPMTLSRAQALDEQLGNMIDSMIENGKPNKVGQKLIEVQSNFRHMIESADDSMIQGGREGFEALKEGRKLWATSRRLNDIERIIDNAQYYQVPATAIKTGFRTLLKNPNKMRGYTAEEAKAIRRAAETGIVSDAMAVFGSRLAPLIGATHGPAGAALGYGASTAARSGATASQMTRANAAARKIAERSGMVKTEQRISADTMRRIMRLPPKEAMQVLEEAKQSPKLLSAPERAQVVSPSGTVRTQTPEEYAAAAAERQRLGDLGLTPDVVAAQTAKSKREILEKYGSSSLGRFLAENPNLTLDNVDERTLERMLQQFIAKEKNTR